MQRFKLHLVELSSNMEIADHVEAESEENARMIFMMKNKGSTWAIKSIEPQEILPETTKITLQPIDQILEALKRIESEIIKTRIETENVKWAIFGIVIFIILTTLSGMVVYFK